ncbi:MAG: GtrA family protein [Pseudomarimonas sp.]
MNERIRVGDDRSRTLREAVAYAVVGGVQLLVDWLCFVCLTWAGIAVAPANLAARVLGALLGFALNARYTFAGPQANARRLPRRLLRFLMFWLLATAISTWAVNALSEQQGLWAAWLGKPMVDAGLALLGFVVSKYWIYR